MTDRTVALEALLLKLYHQGGQMTVADLNAAYALLFAEGALTPSAAISDDRRA